MKKIFKLIIISIIISFIFTSLSQIFAYNDIVIPGSEKLSENSIFYNSSGDIKTDINNTGFRILAIAKVILEGLFLIFIVYAGGQMIMSMGENEEQLSSSKRQLWYGIIALIFINIPGSLYEAFKRDSYGKIDGKITKSSFVNDNLDGNIFINPFKFGHTFEDNIIGFFKIAIYASALVVFIIHAYKLMMSKGNEEEFNKAKQYIYYSIIALVFAGLIDVWKYFAFDGSISEGINIFQKMANIALFLAGPVAIFFMTLAGYYYITSNGEEERVKKAKSIIINTVLGVLIMLASYSFLLDLANL